MTGLRRLAACVLLLLYLVSGCNSEDSLRNPWEYARELEEKIVVPTFPVREYNIKDFGAVSDGATDCSMAIHKAIHTCSTEGGGKVIVPEGMFLTGSIHLENNVNLYISRNGILMFSTDRQKYLPVVITRMEGMECMNYSPFIYAYNRENVAITGEGTLNGQGQAWWHWKGPWSGTMDTLSGSNSQENQLADIELLQRMVSEGVPVEERIFGEGHYLRPSFIQLYLCKNVLIEGVTIVQSPMWVIHPVLSSNVTVSGVRIESLGPNNDGCNPESSDRVLIKDCYFNTGDDCIAIKSGRNNDGRRIGVPSSNILIRNCTMAEGHGGVVIGSETSGNVNYIFAENCLMDSPHLERAVRIKSNSARGGKIEHIYIRDIEVKQVKEAVLKINMYYDNEDGDYIPQVSDVVMEDVQARNSAYGIWIEGCKELPVRNILLKNCNFSNVAYKNHIENAKNLKFENLVLNGVKL